MDTTKTLTLEQAVMVLRVHGVSYRVNEGALELEALDRWGDGGRYIPCPMNLVALAFWLGY